MKRAFIFFLAVGLLAAAPKGTNKPAAVAELKSFKIKVVFGDRTSDFVIEKTEKGGVIKFENNAGMTSSREISAENYKYLVEKTEELKGTSNSTEFCRRNFAAVILPKGTKLGCMGASNPMAQKIDRFVNLLSVLM